MNDKQHSDKNQFAPYDLLLFGLAVVSLINLSLWILLPPKDEARRVLSFFDSLIALVFLFDFFRSLYRATNRRAYLKWGWLDFLGGIPITGLSIFRWARVFRNIRVLRAVGGRDIMHSIRKQLASHVFISVLLLMSIVVVFGAIFIARVERAAPGSMIETPGQAIWWAIVTITTVGYGDKVPVTPAGRTLAVVLMFIGVGLASLLTGMVARFFITTGRSEEDMAATKSDIESLRAEIAEIRKMLSKE
jgi:voltage-gated potassium channel